MHQPCVSSVYTDSWTVSLFCLSVLLGVPPYQVVTTEQTFIGFYWCVHTANVECWGLLLRCSVLSFVTLFNVSWRNRNKHVWEPHVTVTRCRVRKTGKPLAMVHRLSPSIHSDIGRHWIGSHPSSSWGCQTDFMCLNFHQFVFVFFLFVSYSASSFLHQSPHRPPLFSSLFRRPSFPLLASHSSACRDCLHLQHTWGIKEGWNPLIYGRSEKKKKGPLQYSTLSMGLWDP